MNASPEGARLRPGDPAPDASVYDHAGQLVKLSPLWPHGPVLLVFLRHFGCVFCREWLARLQARYSELAQAGLLVIAVGLGQPADALRTGRRHAPDLTVLAAPDSTPYAAYGIVRAGMGQLLSPRTFKAGARAAVAGHTQGRATGDQQMLGGAFVIDRLGVVRLAHYDSFPGDLPDLERLIALAKRLTRADGESASRPQTT
jgi:peroxiredoxin